MAGMCGKHLFHERDGTLDQGAAAFVEGGDGDGDLAPAFARAIQIDDDAARIRIERLLALAALPQQPERFGVGQ